MKRESTHAVRVDAGGLGVSNAVHASAPGKAMLAWLPEAEIRRIAAAGGMAQFTPATITNIDELIEALRIVRRSGFAMDREEFQPGVISFAVAVREHSGGVIGAISVSAPVMRASKDHLALLCSEVVAAARELSAEMGEG
jgi:IclR family acetate operon transcriptional repressor